MGQVAELAGLTSEEASEREILLQKTLRLSNLDASDADQTALRVIRQELVNWLFRFPDDASVMGCLEWLDTSLEVTARRRHVMADRK